MGNEASRLPEVQRRVPPPVYRKAPRSAPRVALPPPAPVEFAREAPVEVSPEAELISKKVVFFFEAEVADSTWLSAVEDEQNFLRLVTTILTQAQCPGEVNAREQTAIETIRDAINNEGSEVRKKTLLVNFLGGLSATIVQRMSQSGRRA